jgi:DNA polymerase-3 subunit gamma/tau
VNSVSLAFLDQIFSVLFNAEANVRQAGQPRLAIEMAFFKIHQITPALPIDLLIERMDSLLSQPLHNESAPGVVEAQSGYGQPPTPLPAVSSPSPSVQESGDVLPSADQIPDGAPGQGRANGSESGEDAWTRVVAAIGEAKPSIAAALSRARLVSATPQEFVVAIGDSEYTLNLVRKNLALVEKICREHAHRGIQIDFNGGKEDGAKTATAKQEADELRQQLLNHPLVADAVDIFSGKIEDIKIK